MQERMEKSETLNEQKKIKYTYFFSENFYDPFENPYKVNDELYLFTADGTKEKVKVIATTIIEQYRQYQLEFSDKSVGWFGLNYIKLATNSN